VTPRDFVYWINGFIELNESGINNDGINPNQVEIIKDHINQVIKKETPNRIDQFSVPLTCSYSIADRFAMMDSYADNINL
jgi:hypothetical protein